jgi:hypothetical protein
MKGNDIVPKLIVLFFGAESPAVALAEAAAEGAKDVRFTEVDVRSGAAHQATTERRYKGLESAASVREYDSVILACPAAGDISTELSTLLDEWEQSSPGALTNTVFGIVGGENTVVTGRVMRLGGILVAEPPGATDPELGATRLGARVATVAGWVRHALSHEHEHQAHAHPADQAHHEHGGEAR